MLRQFDEIESILRKLSGISQKFYLWKYFEKNEEICGTFCRNKFQDGKSFEKIPCKCWRNYKVTTEKMLTELEKSWRDFEEMWRFFTN